VTLKINAGNFVTAHYLIVESDGVKFTETSIVGAKRFRFSEIDCILMSPDHKLSFQVGKETFSIPTVPENSDHQSIIATLVHQVKRAHGVAEQPSQPL
jgi:hypothetical protein